MAIVYLFIVVTGEVRFRLNEWLKAADDIGRGFALSSVSMKCEHKRLILPTSMLVGGKG